MIGEIRNNFRIFFSSTARDLVVINNAAGNKRWFENCCSPRTIVIFAISGSMIIISLITIITVLIIFYNSNTELIGKGMTTKGDNTQNQIDSAQNSSLPENLKLVTRLERVAQPPVEPANNLSTPVPYVIILHTATENCSSPAQCVFYVRFIQTFHIESRHWWDIGYNFLVGGDGKAYEGRGWKSQGAHTFGYNAKSIGIAFIGRFTNFKPPERQIVACKRLIAKGLELGFIRKDYKLLAARQLQPTQSPGEALYNDMKTWDHWASSP